MSRDFQREQVYNAERDVRSLFMQAHERPTLRVHGSVITVPEARRFGSLEGVQTFVSAVQSMGWYRRAYPDAGPITVRVRKDASKAHYERGTATIAIAADRTHRRDQWAMHEPYVLHEMAHHVSTDGHGPNFCAALLRHLGEVMGPEARLIMEDAMHASAVKINYRTLV